MEEANKLIGTGKKHLVMGKVVEAVGALQEACGMLAKKYGDTADECGEAFFWCGKALLDLARMENSVLGNALEGVPEEDEADEGKPKDSNIESTENIDEKTRDELRVQVYDAMAEKKTEEADKQREDAEKTEAADEQQKTEKAAEEEKTSEANGSKSAEKEDEKENEKEPEKETADKEKPAEKKEPAEKEESEDKPEEAEDGEEGEEEEEEEEEDGEDVEMEGDAEGEGVAAAEKDSEDEEVGNLQLAWEMLEVAKVIYKRKETKEDQLMAAQAHLKLGEVSAESGNYTQALEDFKECLRLQVNNLDCDSRLLAETHYQLGLTYSLNLQYSEAIESLNSSITAIKSRLENLQKMLDKAEGPEALPEERKEMEELKALLPEIQEKVEDANESLKTASISAEAVKDVLDGGSSSSSGFPGSTAQNEDSSSSSATKGKSENGASPTNGQTSTAPVSDISHLVRKKRKPEESPVKESVKKVKQDDAQTDEVKEVQTNGDHKANGDAKEHTNGMEVEGK